LQSTDLSAPEIPLPLVESVENEIFITQEFVQQRFLGISFHDDESIFVYTEIRHREARTRIKNFTATKIRECRIRRTVKKKSVSQIECSVQGEVIGAYEMRQLQGREWTQSEIDKPSVNVSINFKVNRFVRRQYRRKKKANMTDGELFALMPRRF